MKSTSWLDQLYFVGRETALGAFKDFLDIGTEKVFFILGEGGVGKTWFLRRTKKLVEEQYMAQFVSDEITDLIATQYHRITGLQNRIIELSGKKEAFAEYTQEFHELLDMREQHRGYKYAKRAMQEKTAYLEQLFYNGCRRAFENKTGILWFDTFEIVCDNPAGYWLLVEFPPNVENVKLVISGREIGFRVDETVVRQYRLGGLAPQDTQEFYRRRSDNTLDSQVTDNANPPSDLQIWARLCEKLAYHPLYLDLARLWADSGLLDFEALDLLPQDEIIDALFLNLRRISRVPGVVSDDMLRQYTREELLKIELTAYVVILYIAFFNRRFDEQFLAYVYPQSDIIPEVEYAQIALRQMMEIPNLFFIKKREGGLNRSGGYLQLHDAVCEHIMTLLWPERDPLGKERSDLRHRAVEWYDQLIGVTKDEFEREELQVEQLGYILGLDLAKGYSIYKESFERNFSDERWGICQLLLNEISPFLKDLSMTHRHEVQDLRFRLALSQNHFESAYTIARWPDQFVSYWLNRQRYYVYSDIQEALRCAYKALEIAQQNGNLDAETQTEFALGFTYRVLGNLDESIRWYKKSQRTARSLGRDAAKLYAQALNNEGYVWALTGNYSDAFEIVSNALLLRRKLDNPLDIGTNLSTLGEIARLQGDFHLAEKCYREALSIFEELRAFDWQAIVWHQRADNARRNAKTLFEQPLIQDKTQVAKYLRYALHDIELSMILYEKCRLRRERAKMWLRQGLIYRDRAKLESRETNDNDLKQAESWLQKAYTLASQSEDVQEALDCLIYISEIQIWMGDLQQVADTLKEIDELKNAYNYLSFCALRDIQISMALIAQGNYILARKYYIQGLVHLAEESSYGQVRLDSQIDGMRKLLDSLPTAEERRVWCLSILENWRARGLNTKIPRVSRVVQGYLDLIDL